MEQTPGQLKSSQLQTPLKQVLADRHAVRLEESLAGNGLIL